MTPPTPVKGVQSLGSRDFRLGLEVHRKFVLRFRERKGAF
jgi:hypothetical protein